MTKPIAYYLSDPDDADTIAEIAVTYGDRLDALDRTQKKLLLDAVTDELTTRIAFEDGPLAILPDGLVEQVASLSSDTLLGLMSATAEQLRHGK